MEKNTHDVGVAKLDSIMYRVRRGGRTFLLKNILHKTILNDIVSNMKTTIDISDQLLKEAKKLSAKRKITLRSLVEQGLRDIIAKQNEDKKFKLRKASFRGNGLQDEFRGESWQKIRSTAYHSYSVCC